MDSDTLNFESLTAAARDAAAAGDLNATLVAWNRVRALDPGVPAGYLGLANALTQANRLQSAEVILRQGLANCPDDPEMLERFAWLAHEGEHWPEAHNRWTDFRRRFPDRMIAYAADGVALRLMGKFDEAMAVYREVFTRWPTVSEFDLLADYAELAQERDLDDGSRLWAALRRRFPDRQRCYVRDAANLSAAGRHAEAETLLSEALARWPDELTALIEIAHVAQRRGATEERLRRWDAVIGKFPERIDGYLGLGYALLDLERFADAQAVLARASQSFPESMQVAALHARIAFAQDAFSEAATRWTAFRQRFPAQPAGYAGGVDAHLAVSNYADARALSDTARELFPQDLEVAIAWSSVPELVKNWEETERRWAATCEQFPAALHVKSRYVRALLQNKQWDSAEGLLNSVLATQSGDFGLLRSYAECATERGDWENAQSRWRSVLDGFPESSAGFSGLGDMLRRAGRLDESVVILMTGLRTFTGDPDLEQRLAWTLTYQRAWPEALALWEALTRKYPRKPSVVGGTTFALTQARQDLDLAASEGAPQPFDIPLSLLSLQEQHGIDNADLKKLFMQFESLGDSCEFGMVQRQFGAEPLGLLRWASTTPAQLIAAFDNALSGVGDPETTVIEASEGEYVTWDTRYSMHSHTFIPDTAEPLASFTDRHLRRMRYLRRKLLEDLEAGQKIFVYKSYEGLSERDAQALHASMRRYNPRAALMYVILAGESHSPGTLEWFDHGLFIGFIDRFSTVDINVNVWVELCRKALELRSPSQQLRFAS
jgi:tetratricopeptide (TPR) repeat protein